MQTAQNVVPLSDAAADEVSLDYDARFLRRKVLTTRAGRQVLIDLPRTTSIGDGDALQTTDGALIRVVAAPEPLLEITGQDLHRIAWHVGNRHTPCQIEAARLLIQQDKVMTDMLTKLGAQVREVTEPFTPEGGAYGHGRTHGHDQTAAHGPYGSDHEHTHHHEH
ncbi:urease accessory protein UreE [uncultured Roseobacter sp.]|uniref:urease accessory protein UreE n=1 Tax=uncultured Roseobacter sp. TaxID=114847 RepID=UPI002611AD59|nr:urease accessory protein UreE [uncultured Roseobacter sp.]